MDPRFDETKRARARELYESGLTVRAVAAELELSVSRTHELLRQAGAAMRAPGAPRKEVA